MDAKDQCLNRRELLAAAACVAAAGRRREAQAQPVRGEPLRTFRAGACAIDITPTKFPVIVNGGFLANRAGKAHDRLHARCLVLDDSRVRLAIVVVDNCLMPRELLDEAKALAHKACGIAIERVLIAATHTHSAPSVAGALGTPADEAYAKYLPGRIAEGIKQAAGNLAPAQAGWTVVQDHEHTNCRRWILRPDRVGADPFGGRTVRAMMHPGYQNPAYVGPAGPIDPGLTILSVQSPDGRPIALLANYSMHYFGAPAVSADYYGAFCRHVARLIGAEKAQPPFVAIMSQGTSGDLHWMDYSRPRKRIARDAYAEAVARVAAEAHKKIRHGESVSLAMCEKKLTLSRRVPDEKRLAWAKAIAAKMKGPVPRNRTEVYALEQILLHKAPARELKLQALRIGGLGMVAMPCEVFGITGLKIKAQSPLEPTMNFELANGADGYIPPPEQHALGGYTTWPARSAGLEVQAEPKIVETVLKLLEEVSGKPRRKITRPSGPYVKSVAAARPVALWRLGEIAGPRALDDSGGDNHGAYEGGVALYLPGPQSPGFGSPGSVQRAAHFAGGRMKARVAGLGEAYSVELWFWNGLPNNARAVTGYLFSRGTDGAKDAAGDHLGIGGKDKSVAEGKLVFYNGNTLKEVLVGKTEIRPKTWNHVVLVRDGRKVTVYLNGKAAPEIAGAARAGCPAAVKQVFVGGRNDNLFNFEGKICESALYGRALSADEAARHYAASAQKRAAP